MVAREIVIPIGMINVPSKVGLRAWRQCFRLTDQRAEIFCINETFLPRAKRLYLQLAKEGNLGQYGTRIGPNPVFWDKSKWRFVSAHQYRLHARNPDDAQFRRYPGFNDARWVTEVVLEHVDRPHMPQVVVLGTHMVPSGRKNPRKWREAMRAESKRVLNRLIDKHRRAGRIVIVMGDTNIRLPFRLNGVRWIRGLGIDKIGIALPAGVTLVRKWYGLYRAPTDHRHGVAARVRLRYQGA